MQGRTGIAALVTCALIAVAAGAQTPPADDAGRAMETQLAALRKLDDPAAREAAADALAALAARSDVDADLRKRLLAGVRGLLTGPDEGARSALLAALGAKGRAAAVLAWREPLLTLVFDPAIPNSAMTTAVRRLCDADVQALGELIGKRIEDRARPPAERRRAIEAAGAWFEQDLRTWGPVESLLKACDDAEVAADALRVLRFALVFPDTMDKDQIRAWFRQHRGRHPANVMVERLRKRNEKAEDEAERTKAWLLEVLTAADAAFALRALDFPYPTVRIAAARRIAALDRAAARPALDPLVRRLEQEASADVRLACAEAIQRLVGRDDAAAIQVLIGRQKAETDPRVRAVGVAALGNTQAEVVISVMLDALKIDPEPTVRRAAAKALQLQHWRGRVKVDAVAPALDHTVESSPQVRLEVARALGELGQGGTGDAGACIPLANALGGDPDREVRWAAAYGLGLVRCSGTEAVDALALAVAQDAEPKVRVRAAVELGRRREPAERDPAVAALLGALKDADGDVQAAARAALVELGGKDGPALALLADRAEVSSLLAAAELLEAALAVKANGGGHMPLDALGENTVHRRLADLWPRTCADGRPGAEPVDPAVAAERAVVHLQVLYRNAPTVSDAMSLARLQVQAGRLGDAMAGLQAAAKRFPDRREALLGAGLEHLDRWADGMREAAAGDALVQLGELPEALRDRGVRLAAAAEGARALAAITPATRAGWHEKLRGASGPTRDGYVDACLRRLKQGTAEAAVEADSSLEQALGRRPVDLPSFPAAPTAEDRALAHSAWERERNR